MIYRNHEWNRIDSGVLRKAKLFLPTVTMNVPAVSSLASILIVCRRRRSSSSSRLRQAANARRVARLIRNYLPMSCVHAWIATAARDSNQVQDDKLLDFSKWDQACKKFAIFCKSSLIKINFFLPKLSRAFNWGSKKILRSKECIWVKSDTPCENTSKQTKTFQDSYDPSIKLGEPSKNSQFWPRE